MAEVDRVKAVCAPPALCILTTPGFNRRPRSCLKPTLATCKWSAMRCEISTGRPDASFRPFPFAVRRLKRASPLPKDEHSGGVKDSLLANSSDPVEMRRLNYQTP
ncbi:receptor-type tyrosine-protein phosphatase F-like isoform X1, partial [Lates japonicus]